MLDMFNIQLTIDMFVCNLTGVNRIVLVDISSYLIYVLDVGQFNPS